MNKEKRLIADLSWRTKKLKDFGCSNEYFFSFIKKFDIPDWMKLYACFQFLGEETIYNRSRTFESIQQMKKTFEILDFNDWLKKNSFIY